MTECVIFEGATGLTVYGNVCGKPAKIMHVYACVHEHMIDTPLCLKHVDHMNSVSPWFCTICHRAGCYRCKLTLISEKILV